MTLQTCLSPLEERPSCIGAHWKVTLISPQHDVAPLALESRDRLHLKEAETRKTQIYISHDSGQFAEKGQVSGIPWCPEYSESPWAITSKINLETLGNFLMFAVFSSLFMKSTLFTGNRRLIIILKAILSCNNQISRGIHTWKMNERLLLSWQGKKKKKHCNVLQCTKKIYNACIINNVSASSLFRYFYSKAVIFKLFQINVFLYINAFVLRLMKFLWTEGCKEDDVLCKLPDDSMYRYQSTVRKHT